MAKPPSGHGLYIKCPGLASGREEMYPADQVRFRPAAYGLFVHAGRILLGRSRFTGKWDIPGGGVEAWETLEDGVAREFLEETGVRVCASKLVDFRESFIAFGHHPFHSLRYYYAVAGDPGQTLTPDLTELSSVDWVGLDAIRLEECAPGDFALIERIVKDKGERD